MKNATLKKLASTIRGRRTVKMFQKKTVDSEIIMDAIDLARWAPNHHLTEPWHFYLLNDSIIKKCVDLIQIVVNFANEKVLNSQRSLRTLSRRTSNDSTLTATLPSTSICTFAFYVFKYLLF